MSRRPSSRRHGGAQMGMENLNEMLGKAFGGMRAKPRKMRVAEGPPCCSRRKATSSSIRSKVMAEAVERRENGILFVDEWTRSARASRARGADVCREGVQRDLLPIVEGTTVTTSTVGEDRPHPVHRGRRVPPGQAVGPDAGAAGPLSDPRRAEGPRQGRLRSHPDGARTPDQAVRALLETEGVDALFTPTPSTRWPTSPRGEPRRENIGARRLYTILERVEESASPPPTRAAPASPSTRLTCATRSPIWRRTRICGSSFCNARSHARY